MRHLLHAFAGVFLLLASAAQAGTQPDDKLQPGEGAVLLTVSVDYPTFANANANAMPGWIPQLTVERIAEGKPQRYILPNRLDGLQSTRSYAGSLPPGRYRVYDIMGNDCRFWCGDGGLSVPKAGDLGEFTIEAGQVRYLGSILASVQGPVPPSKKWTVWWGYSEKPEAAVGQRLLAGLYPELAAAAQGHFSAGWEPGDVAKTDAARERIRRINSGLFDPSPYGSDGFFFGAQNGVIKRWNRSEGVRLIDTGSPFLLRTVLHGSDGRMLAGGEASTLIASNDDGRSWADVSAGLPYGIVLNIRSLGGDELVFSMQSGKNAAIYRGKLGEAAWTKVGEWPMEFAFWTGMPGAQPALQVQGHKLAMTLPSRSGVFVDLDSGETHPITPPGSLAFFSYTADGVMRCTCMRSIAANPWESHDLGRTWTDSPLDRWMLLPVFRDAQTAFSYKGALFSKKKAGVVITHDGGKTWAQSPGPGDGGWWLPNYSADGSVMLLSGIAIVNKDAVEQVHWSTDQGATWTAWVNEGIWLYGAPASADAAAPPSR
jgi:photosystem II stability/assembly factor-like uncharacterized protein